MSVSTLFPQWLKNYYHWLNAFIAVHLNRYPAKYLTVIGVTGTDGKTTTSSMIYQILKTAGYRVALISTIGAYIGSELYPTGFHVTSPDPLKLQKFLRQLVRQGFTHVVLEVTSHGLDQHRVFGTRIQYAVITNVTREHLDYHKNYNAYIKAKAKIFQGVKTVIINRDDISYPYLKKYLTPSIRLLSYSLSDNGPNQQLVRDCFPQTYNQANALAAVTLADDLNINDEYLRQALQSPIKLPGRLETIPNNINRRLVVDFAHTPNALQSVLEYLKQTTNARLIIVFGAAGQRDQGKRPLMGSVAAAVADEVIITSEDPRTEDPRLIIHQILEGATQNHGHLHSVIDRQSAINLAINLSHPGDTVAVFGKGHETTQNLDGRHEIPWSDQQAVIRAVHALKL